MIGLALAEDLIPESNAGPVLEVFGAVCATSGMLFHLFTDYRQHKRQEDYQQLNEESPTPKE